MKTYVLKLKIFLHKNMKNMNAKRNYLNLENIDNI